MKNIHIKSSEIIKNLQSKVNSLENYIKENNKKNIDVQQTLKQSFERKQSMQNNDAISEHNNSIENDNESIKSMSDDKEKESLDNLRNNYISRKSTDEIIKKERISPDNNRNNNDNDKDGSNLLFDADDSYY
jgi:hypothetical protein